MAAKVSGPAAVLLGIFGVPLAAAAQGPAVPVFVEETAAAGVNSVYAGEWHSMVGGGVAVFDCDGDGFPDMLLAGGEAAAKFYRNASAQGGPLRFAEQASGLEETGVTGAYPLDLDGDGVMDLALLRVGENLVMRGLGNCRFARANELWAFNGGDAWTAAFAAMWEKDADWPTLAIGNYIDRREETAPWGTCTANWLHRPAGRAFAEPLALTPSYCALSMLFTDWNRSGAPSLRVSNDREYYEGGQEQLWHIDPGLPPRLYSEAEGWKPLKIWGMGIASYDLDFDGYPEYYLTSMADQKLQTLAPAVPGAPPAPAFKDVAWPRGVTAHRPFMGADLRPSTGWHAQFEDVNNDGLADLFVAKGNVDRMPDFAANDPNNLLLQGADGKFVEAADKAGVASAATSRGAALVDFNLDGKLDLVVVNRRESAQVWRSVSAGLGHWAQFRVQQPGANRDAIGAWIEVKLGDRILRREITAGGGHASGQNGWRHVGLGSAAQTEARVIWPDGASGVWETIAADRFYVLERDQAARAWTPER